MTFPLKRFTVSGNSMLPTLKPGQDVLVWCWFNKYRVGDIVVIRHESKEVLKRISKIDDRRIFVTGDNKIESTDSRKFGWIPADQVIGKVIWYQGAL